MDGGAEFQRLGESSMVDTAEVYCRCNSKLLEDFNHQLTINGDLDRSFKYQIRIYEYIQ